MLLSCDSALPAALALVGIVSEAAQSAVTAAALGFAGSGVNMHCGQQQSRDTSDQNGKRLGEHWFPTFVLWILSRAFLPQKLFFIYFSSLQPKAQLCGCVCQAWWPCWVHLNDKLKVHLEREKTCPHWLLSRQQNQWREDDPGFTTCSSHSTELLAGWCLGLEPRQEPGTPSAWLLCAFCFVSCVPPAQIILRPGSGLLLSSRTSYIHKLCAYQGSVKYIYSADLPGSVWIFQNWKWLSALRMRPAMTMAFLDDFLCMVQLCVSLWAGWSLLAHAGIFVPSLRLAQSWEQWADGSILHLFCKRMPRKSGSLNGVQEG